MSCNWICLVWSKPEIAELEESTYHFLYTKVSDAFGSLTHLMVIFKIILLSQFTDEDTVSGRLNTLPLIQKYLDMELREQVCLTWWIINQEFNTEVTDEISKGKYRKSNKESCGHITGNIFFQSKRSN